MVSHRVSQKWSTEVRDMYSEVFTIGAQNKIKKVICIHREIVHSRISEEDNISNKKPTNIHN